MIGSSERLSRLSIQDQIIVRNHAVGMYEGFLSGAKYVDHYSELMLEKMKKVL
ncbi:hypothetical protein PAV_5c04620 [Paenibacillus alvei DSM 29]|nr:hypothetical protein PAV_5c04620 [Paenibacillus alvei DSM 29]